VRIVLVASALALVAALAGPAPPARAAPTDDARALVSRTLDEALAVLRERARPERERRRRVEEIAYIHFDFATMSRLILGRNWPKLSPAQRDAFVAELKRHLAAAYWRTLEDYSHQKVEVAGARAEHNGDVTVRTTIKGERSEPWRVDYRLRPREGTFVVIDLVIEGVSLVQNFRSQTQEIIGDSGADALIERLRRKNEERERKTAG
jgi:phospholipid transport system substrate-binding protein